MSLQNTKYQKGMDV